MYICQFTGFKCCRVNALQSILYVVFAYINIYLEMHWAIFLEEQLNVQLPKEKKITPGCSLCFLSAQIRWRVSVSIYIQMSPSIFPRAVEGFTFSTVMHLTNLSSLSGDKLMMHSEKVRGNSMFFAFWSLLCVFLLLNCHWYSVIFVSEMELISFVYISLKREAVHCLKRLTWNHWEGLDGWILFWWRNC